MIGTVINWQFQVEKVSEVLKFKRGQYCCKILSQLFVVCVIGVRQAACRTAADSPSHQFLF